MLLQTENVYGLKPYKVWQHLAASLLILGFSYYQFKVGTWTDNTTLYMCLFMAAFVWLPDFYWYGSAESGDNTASALVAE